MPMKKKTTTKKTSGVNTQGMDPEFISLLNAMKPLGDIVEWDEILEGMVPNYTYHFIENTAKYIIATALDDPDIEISSAVREDDKELAYIFGIIFLALGTALMERADFGMSMIRWLEEPRKRSLRSRRSIMNFPSTSTSKN